MPATPSGADTLANQLLLSLIAGKDFSLPDLELGDAIFQQPASDGDLHGPVDKLEVSDLTAGVVGGDGAFDRLMSSLKVHLKEEFTANRISGAEYTKAYIGLVTAGLQTAAQFLLGKDQAYWSALLVQQQAKIAQIEAVKARLELETARAALVRARYEAVTAEAAYGLTKMKISTEDATYSNLANQGLGIVFTNENILPNQKKLLEEQIEVQRAQTMDTRSDGVTPITGSVGKQKQLYDQQITSYKRDAETKAVKLFTDAWITQKTIDEGLLAPTQFNNANIDQVIAKLRANLDMTA